MVGQLGGLNLQSVTSNTSGDELQNLLTKINTLSTDDRTNENTPNPNKINPTDTTTQLLQLLSSSIPDCKYRGDPGFGPEISSFLQDSPDRTWNQMVPDLLPSEIELELR